MSSSGSYQSGAGILHDLAGYFSTHHNHHAMNGVAITIKPDKSG